MSLPLQYGIGTQLITQLCNTTYHAQRTPKTILVWSLILAVSWSLMGCTQQSESTTSRPSSAQEAARPSSAEETPHQVHFPVQASTNQSQVQLAAELNGELREVDGCLRIVDRSSGTSFLVIWPADYTLQVEAGEIGIRDGSDQVVARVGDTVAVGGGAFGETPGSFANTGNLPPDCAPPYWTLHGQVKVTP